MRMTQRSKTFPYAFVEEIAVSMKFKQYQTKKKQQQFKQ